jgi:hypothetical protein
MPVLHLPYLLTDEPRQPEGKQITAWTLKMDMDKIDALLKKYPGCSIAPPPINIPAFARFIAKVTHAGMVHMVGFQGFKPLLRETIMGGTVHDIYDLVGGEAEKHAKQPDLRHQLAYRWIDRPGERFLLARVRLFADQGAPIYYAVAGTFPTWTTREEALEYWRTKPSSSWVKPKSTGTSITTAQIEPGVGTRYENTQRLTDGIRWVSRDQSDAPSYG